MSTTDFQWARIPINPDGTITCYNASNSTTISSNYAVSLDTSNLLSSTQQAPGVVLSATGDLAFGVAIETIAPLSFGRVQIDGLVQCISQGSITANTCVQTYTDGLVETCTTATPQLGQALTATTGNGQYLLVRLALARNS